MQCTIVLEQECKRHGHHTVKTVGLANLKREQREVILLAEKDIFVALPTVTGRRVPSEFVGELE